MTNYSQVLETVMLLCFGFSWPINLVKNYRLRSAKSMSLSFLLLIWTGYIAGIAAKVLQYLSPEMNNPSWYLLAIYTLNFLMLSANLLVYFRNLRLDKQR